MFVLTEDFDSKRVLHELLIKSASRTIPKWAKSTHNSSMYLNRYNKSSNVLPEEINVTELTSESFQSVVFNSSQVDFSSFHLTGHEMSSNYSIFFQHVIVYYYTPYCSYCQVSAYTFLYVAYVLRNYSRIKFTRIDSENNDLHWHLVPHSYPTIILFPAGR